MRFEECYTVLWRKKCQLLFAETNEDRAAQLNNIRFILDAFYKCFENDHNLLLNVTSFE